MIVRVILNFASDLFGKGARVSRYRGLHRPAQQRGRVQQVEGALQ